MHLDFACLTHSPFPILNIAMSCKAQSVKRIPLCWLYILLLSLLVFCSSSSIILLNIKSFCVVAFFGGFLHIFVPSLIFVDFLCLSLFLNNKAYSSSVQGTWCTQWWRVTICMYTYGSIKPITHHHWILFVAVVCQQKMQKNVKPFYTLN